MSRPEQGSCKQEDQKAIDELEKEIGYAKW
jgi:hypothetical protein